MNNGIDTPSGLTTAQAQELQELYGKNELIPQKKTGFIRKALSTIAEPMFLLLLVAATIYFVLGEPRDGAIMLASFTVIITIDVIQKWKTDRALNALRDLSAPKATVIRDGKETVIASTDLVPGDLMLLNEGVKVPADAVVLRCNDLIVDESTLTGEAEHVWKRTSAEPEAIHSYWRVDYCYAGTLVIHGTALVQVEKIGPETEFGKIGTRVAQAPEKPTPLQRQTRQLVIVSASIAFALIFLVGIITYFNTPDGTSLDRIARSVLSGVTLAMAMIPEEFPVILTVFLSMGAWRLARNHSLVRVLPAVETLGSVSVLCVDKTGTITMNQMSVEEVRPFCKDIGLFYETMGLACETDAYDPMEKAILAACEEVGITREHLISGELITEYPFTNATKMMGHVWRREGNIVIAVKGSPESVLPLCGLSQQQRELAESTLFDMSADGLRVIAIASMTPNNESAIPESLPDSSLTLCGLIGLSDPPREGVAAHIDTCTKAGIRVIMITGDNGVTASAIARRIGMPNVDHIITGDKIDGMDDQELQQKVKDVSIFSRVIPEHKLRIVKALKENGEVVAMTGDGVNDAPALKYADIGIAMGLRGSEVAREAADLILLDDDFSTIVETIKDGRRIYDNIRKTVGYIFTIHIPIALASLLGPMLGIPYASLMFLPLHVMLFELITDPTCSIVLERQPAEKNVMDRPPRSQDKKLLDVGVLAKSISLGLVIFAASFGTYYFVLAQNQADAELARGMGLAILILANLLLVQVVSSETESVIRNIRYFARDKVVWAINSIMMIGLIAILYSPLNELFRLAPLPLPSILFVIGAAAASVLWYEVVKFVKRRKIKEVR